MKPRLDQTPDKTQPQLAAPYGFELETMKAKQLTMDFTLLCPRAPADEERPVWVLTRTETPRAL